MTPLFTNRVVHLWNSLPANVISAPTVAQFKKNLDDLWATTGSDTPKGLWPSLAALCCQARPSIITLLNLPPYCDGCGAVFSVEHALDGRVGGLVGQWHNEVRGAIGDLASLAWGQVQKEPVICEETVDSCDDTLIGDLRVQGVWQLQTDAVFDIHVV